MPRPAKNGEASTPMEDDWIAAAREMLVTGGVAAVQINALATRLGVTRGGFYWRFRDRKDLLDHLLADWQNTNTRAFLMAVGRAGSPKERFRRLARLWIDEKDFNPGLDTAVRQWSAVDQEVRHKVRDADEQRIKALIGIFLDAGISEDEAMIRGRIYYFHQVGYYEVGMRETKQERTRLADLYNRILTGFE